tara:strand:- start:37691 stop:38104 length:414 start_codon:yes stop_codon:yes gene_type:complete
MSEVEPKPANELGQSLGQVRVVSMDAEAGRAAIEYRCGMHMCHSGGVAQGGFVTGWIDAAMAHATMAATNFAYVPMSLEIKVSFFRPAAPGLVTAEAWIEQKGRSTVFLEGKLTDEAGNILAKATSTVRLIPREKFA